MKKAKIILMIILIPAILLASGCKTDSAKENDVAVSTSIVHDSSSGVWFIISTGIAECLSKTYEDSVMQATPGEPMSNIYRTNENATDFGITHTSKAYEAINGTGQFEEKQDNVSGVMVFYPSSIQFGLREELGVTSLKDFLDRKVPLKLSIGLAGGNSQFVFQQMLAYYGLTLKDLEEWGCKFYNKAFKDTEQMFADGAIDGFWLMAGAPTNIIVQMGINSELMLVPFEQDLLDSMVNDYGFAYSVIKKGTYAFEDNDINSFAASSMLIASKETSEDTVYKVTKAVCENIEYMSSVHAVVRNFSVETILDGMIIPLHPGAEKYYREIGLID